MFTVYCRVLDSFYRFGYPLGLSFLGYHSKCMASDLKLFRLKSIWISKHEIEIGT